VANPPPAEQPPAQPGVNPPRPGQQPAPEAEPPLAPPAADKEAEPAAAPAAEAVERPPAAKSKGAGRGNSWLTLGVSGLVAAIVLAVSLTLFGSKKTTPKRGARPDKARSRPGAKTAEKPAVTPILLPPPSEPPADVVPPECITAGSPHTDHLSAPPLPPRTPSQPSMALPPEAAPSPEIPSVVLSPALAPSPAKADLTLAPERGPRSRGEKVVCARCERSIAVENGMPPWCPHCGGDLKAGATQVNSAPPIPASAQPVQASDTAGAKPPPNLQPPYFIGRSGRTYRIYVLPSKLLFVNAPARDDRSGGENVVKGVSMQGGLIGGMIGGAVAATMAGNRHAKARERAQKLDLADTQELIELAENEPQSFAVNIDRLEDVRVEAIGFLENCFSDRCSARLHFRHHTRGNVAVDLPTPDDVRVAIKQLTALLGDRLEVNAAWDAGKQRWVAK
jgi:hypothetical protein